MNKFSLSVFLSFLAGGMFSQDLLEYATIESNGLTREYIYFHPESAQVDAPLIYVFHGFGSTHEEIMNFTGFNGLASDNGFAVCYPLGSIDEFGSTFWNVGYDFHSNETVDDVLFVSDLNTHLTENQNIDQDKIFSTGFSNGAEFCYLLLCQTQDIWRGIAPVAGLMLDDMITECAADGNDASISILEIHGTMDPLSVYEGDPQNLDGWGAYPSTLDMLNFWTELAGYPFIEETSFPDTSLDDGNSIDHLYYGWQDWCPHISLYRVNGGVHSWPGVWDNMDVEATEEIWSFFESVMCTDVSIEEPLVVLNDRILLFQTDILGRDITPNYTGVIINFYNDGSSEKRIISE